MKEMELKPHDVVQLSPDVGNPNFAGCFMIVTEPKKFGAQGYVQVLGPDGGRAYYRAKWEEMEFIGVAAFVAGDSNADADQA